MTRVIPDRDWYFAISEEKALDPRCPFATVEACPRYYQSLSLLGEAGSTSINAEEDARLLENWQKSELWPRTREQDTSISGPGDSYTGFSNFCPEVSFERFGYFASYLHRHSDDLDRQHAHERLSEEGAVPGDWGWVWSTVSPMHYTECPLFSVLSHRSRQPSQVVPAEATPTVWDRYGRPITIGVVAAILAGLVLAVI